MTGCPVLLYVVESPAGRHTPLLAELGFRQARKSANWWRQYDLRLPGIPDRVLAVEALLLRLSLLFNKRPLRGRRKHLGAG